MKDLALIISTISSLLIAESLFAKKNITHSAEYTHGQALTISGTQYKIPTYLPHQSMADKLFTDVTIYNGFLDVDFGLLKGCFGRNVCGFSSFSSEKISDPLRSTLTQSFEAQNLALPLSKNLTGYFVPSKCYSYCTMSKLIWFNHGEIYTIGNKQFKSEKENIAELVKSANSYIELDK
jgi:hypothetical protein